MWIKCLLCVFGVFFLQSLGSCQEPPFARLRGSLDLGEIDLDCYAECFSHPTVLHHIRTRGKLSQSDEQRLLALADGLLAPDRDGGFESKSAENRARAFASVILGNMTKGLVRADLYSIYAARARYDSLKGDSDAFKAFGHDYPHLSDRFHQVILLPYLYGRINELRETFREEERAILRVKTLANQYKYRAFDVRRIEDIADSATAASEAEKKLRETSLNEQYQNAIAALTETGNAYVRELSLVEQTMDEGDRIREDLAIELLDLIAKVEEAVRNKPSKVKAEILLWSQRGYVDFFDALLTSSRDLIPNPDEPGKDETKNSAEKREIEMEKLRQYVKEFGKFVDSNTLLWLEVEVEKAAE